MQIGKLRHRIQVLSQTLVRDEGGGSKSVWLLDRELWANVIQKEGVISDQGGQTVTTYPYDIELRWNRDVTLSRLERIRFQDTDIVPHSIIEVDLRKNRCVVKGFSDARVDLDNGLSVQLYEDGSIQLWEG